MLLWTQAIAFAQGPSAQDILSEVNLLRTQPQQYADIIAAIKKRGDKTILLVEHKMDVVRSLSDRIVVLHQGKLVADGKPAEVINSDIVREAYLGGAVDG